MRNLLALLCASVVAFSLLYASDSYILNRMREKPQTIVINRTIGIDSSEMSQDMKIHLIKASYRIATPSGSGTGFAIFSGQRSAESGDTHFYNYLVTCAHVTGDFTTVEVQKFHYSGNKKISAMTSLLGNVVSVDSLHDLALIEVQTDEPFKDLVSLVTPADLKKMRLAEPVWTCGCGLGNPPYVSSTGSISNYDMEGHIQVTSPIIFGNSGGGVYTIDGKLIGVARAIPVLHNGQAYPNAGLCVPVWTVDSWLKINAFGFLNGAKDGSSLDKIFTQRDKAQTEADKQLSERALKKIYDDLLKKMVPPEPIAPQHQLPAPPAPSTPDHEHKGDMPDLFPYKKHHHHHHQQEPSTPDWLR
jgi:hypothetical protein